MSFSGGGSIPLDVAAVAAPLVPLEGVFQHAGVGADGEVVGLVTAEHQSAAHAEAVEVAGDVDGRHGYFLGLEVVAAGEVHVPAFGQLEVAREVEVLCELVGIAHGLHVDWCRAVFAHGDAVGHGERPRHLELQVAVFVDFGRHFFLLAVAPLFAFVQVGELVVVLVVAVLVGVVIVLAKPFLPRVIVEGVREVLAHAREASEASVRPLRALAFHHLAALVELVGVGGETGREVERLALGQFQSQGDVHVAPGLFLGRQVVGHAYAELVDEAQFLHAGRVFVGLHLHLQVVGEREVDVARSSLGRRSVEHSVVVGVFPGVDLAVLVGIGVGVVEAVARAAEVGRHAVADAGGDDVAYHFNLVAEYLGRRLVEAVELRVGRDAEIVVIDAVEAVDGVAHHGLCGGVPVLFHLIEIPTLGVVERGGDVDVVEQREVGLNGDAVLPSVAPVAREVRFEDVVFLGGDGVAYLARVLDGDFLIPAFFSGGFLALEGIDAVEVDVEVGQGERHHGVACALRHVECARHCEADVGERARIAHARCLRALRIEAGVVEAVEVVAVVACRRVVDAGREVRIGVGLGVLTVSPLQAETARFGVVGHSLVSGLDVLIVETEVAGVFVAFVVGRRRIGLPRAFGVDAAREAQVDVVVDGEVVAAVAQVESAGRLVAVAGHEEARRVAAAEGEEAERYGQRQRHVGQHEPRRAEDDVLLGPHLGTAQRQVEVGMLVVVARGVAAVFHVIFLVVALFGVLAGDVAFALLGGDVVDEAAFRLEVVAHLFRLVGRLAVLEHGFALQGAGGVGHAVGMDDAAVHVHGHHGGRQFDALVIDFRVAIHAGETVGGRHHRGVRRREGDGSVERVLFLFRGVGRNGVEGK